MLGRRPNAPTVARRMLCLSVLLYRLGAEGQYRQAVSTEERDSACDTVADIQDFLMDTGLWDAVSLGERPMFKASPGSWTEEMAAHAAWRRESLGVLMWALNLVPEIPPYDRAFEGLGEVVDLGQWEYYVDDALLLPVEAIVRQTEIAHAWFWRSRRGQPPFDEDNNPGLIAEAAAEFLARGLIPQTLEQDFVLFGSPYHQLPEANAAFAGVLASERFYAFQWLVGDLDWA